MRLFVPKPSYWKNSVKPAGASLARRRLPCRQGKALQYPRKAERRKYASRPRRPVLAFLSRLFGARREREALRPLYDALVAAARDPAWYRDGGVPDTLEGRFDMVATLVALALLRLEAEGEGGRAESVQLTELFIDDMDGTLRQIGIGDFVVGKHVGKLVGALGGRLGAFREALGGEAALEPAVRRNLFRDEPAEESHVAWAAERLGRFHSALMGTAMEPLLAGRLPRP